MALLKMSCFNILKEKEEMKMSKEKMMSVVTIASLMLLGSRSVFASDVVDPVAGTIEAAVTTPKPTTTPNVPKETSPASDPVAETTEPTAPASSKPEAKPSDEKKPEESVKPTEPTITPEQSKTEEIKKAEENTGASTTETPKPITTPVIETPIVTNTGHTVVGTQDGNVLVQTEMGTVLKAAAEIGAVKQKDGSVALKNKDGKVQVLPSTGETKAVLTILGIIVILGAIWVGWKDNIKKYLSVFKKKDN